MTSPTDKELQMYGPHTHTHTHTHKYIHTNTEREKVKSVTLIQNTWP